MKNIYKPILYSTPMVQGILEDRKNQTRRTKGLEVINENLDEILELKLINDPDKNWLLVTTKSKGTYKLICPYQIGEILWVRENLKQCGELGLEYSAYGEAIDEGIIPFDYGPYGGEYSFRTIPSIHMPKWACRIFLKVTDLRIERLKEITVWGAEDEGVEKRIVDGHEEFKNYLAEGVTEDEPWGDSYFSDNPRSSFMSLWKSINGLESWDLNPWVWVIKFERIEKPLDFIL